MLVRAGSAFFMPLRGDGPRTVVQPVLFPRAVRRATAGLLGYSVAYPNDDYHIGRLQVQLDAQVDGPLVQVTTMYGLRDWSDSRDDDYSGVIGFVVLADLEDPTGQPPRTDLTITGIEITQATQAFHDFEILDVQTARPDNAIPLVARRPTTLRVYVDYEPVASDPPVTSLPGTSTSQRPPTWVTWTSDSRRLHRAGPPYASQRLTDFVTGATTGTIATKARSSSPSSASRQVKTMSLQYVAAIFAFSDNCVCGMLYQHSQASILPFCPFCEVYSWLSEMESVVISPPLIRRNERCFAMRSYS